MGTERGHAYTTSHRNQDSHAGCDHLPHAHRNNYDNSQFDEHICPHTDLHCFAPALIHGDGSASHDTANCHRYEHSFPDSNLYVPTSVSVPLACAISLMECVKFPTGMQYNIGEKK